MFRLAVERSLALKWSDFDFENLTGCGRIRIYRKNINLSTSCSGGDEGIWLVSFFMSYALGYIV